MKSHSNYLKSQVKIWGNTIQSGGTKHLQSPAMRPREQARKRTTENSPHCADCKQLGKFRIAHTHAHPKNHAARPRKHPAPPLRTMLPIIDIQKNGY